MNKNVNPLVYLGTVANSLITLFTYYMGEYKVLVIPSVISLTLSFIGSLLIVLNFTKVGAILYYIGAVIFIPLSVIGIIGVRRTVEKEKTRKKVKNIYGNKTT
ncbi:hypothetical protein [Tenacibaculum sp.]|uniref:hypothetical protein n=1 Tax=Tenacibaculum sp. TaxID=1906242 RepID=UPI003AA9CFF1